MERIFEFPPPNVFQRRQHDHGRSLYGPALLAAGARTDLQDKYGDTALDAAKGAGVKALLTAAAKKTPQRLPYAYGKR